MNSSQNYTFKFKEEDIKKNKFISVIAYIPLLCFIPIIFKKDSEFAKFHANQGLSLFITEFIMAVLYFALSFIASVFSLIPLTIGLNFISSFMLIIVLSLMLVGVMNASGGLAKSLPFIGGIEIIK